MLALTIMHVCGIIAIMAQNSAGGNAAGTTALTIVTEEIVKYVPIVVNLCYAIAGVVANVGTILVYIAMNNHAFSCLQSHSDLVECGFGGIDGNIVYSPNTMLELHQLGGEKKLLARLQEDCWASSAS